MVFMDELTGALDQVIGGEVMFLLTSACTSTGASFVLATHDPAVAVRLPHAIRMRGGRISLEARDSGTPNQGMAR